MTHWTAILTVVAKSPADAETVRKNPLGIYVDAIDRSRELDPTAIRTPAATVAAPPVPVDAPLGSPTDPTLTRSAAAAPLNLESRP